jgi:predicted enzyme related to lactoylglutathione lyase
MLRRSHELASASEPHSFNLGLAMRFPILATRDLRGLLGFYRDPELSDPPSARYTLWLYVDDCDATVGRLRAAGVPIVEEPADQPWGERIARVLDPDGNAVIVGQR